MEVDFENLEDYISVPPGTYLCEIALVRESTSKAGDPMWGVCLRVADGQHVGHLACWDNLVFSDRGRSRVRDIFAALGLPSQGRVEVRSEELVGRQAFVEVRKGAYQRADGTVAKPRNEVPYDGYRPVAPAANRSAHGKSEPAQDIGPPDRSSDAIEDHVPF